MEKNEKYLWIAILVVVALFIVFMPSIEKVLMGRKNFNMKNDEIKTDTSDASASIKKETYPKSATCLLETNEGETTKRKEVTFTYSTSGTVSKIVEMNTYAYKDQATYDMNKNRTFPKKTGVVETIETDDKNLLVVVKDVMTISEMKELTEYPTKYKELKTYLSTNNYTCTETK